MRGITLIIISSFIYLGETLKQKRQYDYIVVGGGAAGCVLAARLSEDPDVSVLVLEAGKDPLDDPFIRIPFLSDTAKTWPENDWKFYTEPQKLSPTKQRLPLSVCKILGGCHSHNGLAYVRGSPHDYDRWQELGNEGWDYESVLPYFKKSENMIDPKIANNGFHGTKGPLKVRFSHKVPIVQELFKASEELGYKVTDDFNGKQLEGIGNNQFTITSRGERLSTLEAFLRPVMARRNLRVITEALVTKIEIKNKRSSRATGVFYMKNGKRQFIKAGKEVLVSAGAINSPKLLMLSGIGPKMALEKLGIKVMANLPVGKSLQDHFAVIVSVEVSKTTPIEMPKAQTFESLFGYLFAGQSEYATNGFSALAFYSIDGQPKTDLFPYIEHMIGAGNMLLTGKFQPLQDSIRNGKGIIPELVQEIVDADTGHESFFIIPVHLHPRLRGQVTLKSKDPFEPPITEIEYLQNQQDIKDLIEGIKLILKLLNTKAMQNAQVNLVKPDENCKRHKFNTDEYWECYVSHNFFNFLHLSSSCKMANDSTGVVDSRLRVKGIKGLRVVDCSIMPTLISGHTMAPAIMIAEKAADMITQDNKG